MTAETMRTLMAIVERPPVGSFPDDEEEDDARYARLPASDAIKALRPQIAAAAQEVYDGWDQSDPENDDLNGGGICHLIAEFDAHQIKSALSTHHARVTTDII